MQWLQTTVRLMASSDVRQHGEKAVALGSACAAVSLRGFLLSCVIPGPLPLALWLHPERKLSAAACPTATGPSAARRKTGAGAYPYLAWEENLQTGFPHAHQS